MSDPRGQTEVIEPAQEVTDMAPLIARALDIIELHGDESTSHDVGSVDPETFARETGFTARRQGKPELVLASEIAVELGHPSTASVTVVLRTDHADLVHSNRVTWLGPDLNDVETGARLPYGQVVMLATRPEAAPDPFQLDAAGLLINRLPGFMVRSVPGRQWVRISKRGLASGLTLETVGRALIAAYEGEFDEIEGVEVLFVTSSEADVEALASIALEARVASGRHKKLALTAEGDLDCIELSCDECDEQPVCDDLRDVLRQRRQAKRSRSR